MPFKYLIYIIVIVGILKKHAYKYYTEYAKLIEQENDLNAINQNYRNWTTLHAGKFD